MSEVGKNENNEGVAVEGNKHLESVADLLENRDKPYKTYKLNVNSKYFKKLRLLAIYFNKDETNVLEDAVDYLYDEYYKKLLSGLITKDLLNLTFESNDDKKYLKSFKIDSDNGIRAKRITIMTIEFELTVIQLLNLIIEIFFKDKFKIEEI